MAISFPNEFVFEVRRSEPELVCPAKTTPYEFKELSDIDKQESLRCQLPAILFYAHNPCMEGIDPAKVMKKAVAETLVFYYPFAGRLREGSGRKVFVECTAEGVLFIEADAEVSLEQFGDTLRPPFACLDDVLYNVPNSDNIFNSPLLLIQVTRFRCGGFSFAIRANHTMCDAVGFFQLVRAIAEIASGALAPSILPVWQRALLNARDPPRVDFQHREYDEVIDTKGAITVPLNAMAQRVVFFGPAHVSALRQMVPAHLQHCSSIDLITACLWRTRTIALQPDPDEEMRLLCIINLRFTLKFLPLGYYGNAFVFPAAISTAGELLRNPLSYVVELIRKAKNVEVEEYIKSVADLMVIKGHPNVSTVRSFEVSNLTKFEFDKMDFGWGKPIYGGPAIGRPTTEPDFTNYYIGFKNNKGEEGIVVPLSLPAPAMERFVEELDALFNTKLPNDHVTNSKRPLIPSGL